MSAKSPKSNKFPKRPNSSLKTAKIKSVVRSGKKSSWPCEPLSQPLPISPPDPIAIED